VEVKTLACDLCRGVVPAIASIRLGNGRSRKTQHRDLCAVHLRELDRLLRPRVRSAGGTATGRERAIKAGLEKRHPSYWAKVEGRILNALKGTKGPVGAAVLLKKSRVTSSTFRRAARRLAEAGKLKIAGGATRWRTYERT